MSLKLFKKKKLNPNKPKHYGIHRTSTCNHSHDSTDIEKSVSKQTEDAMRKAENTKQSSSYFKCTYRNKVNAIVN